MKRFIGFLLALLWCLNCSLAVAEGLISGETEARTADGFAWKALEDGTAEITDYAGPETEIVIPAEVDGLPVSRIGSFAFEKSAVTRVEIPEGVTAIGRFAFSECRNLASLTLPESLTSLGDCALMLCTSLHTLSIPEGLVEVGSNPFCYCTGLTELVGLEDHPALLFLDNAVYERETRRLVSRLNSAEERIFTVWDECEVIGDYAFADNKYLVSAVLPESVKTVEDLVFFHCTALQTVEFPASVEFIGDACFAQCIAVRMIAPEGSYAWQWAQLNGMSVLAPEVEEPNEPETPDITQESEDAG